MLMALCLCMVRMFSQLHIVEPGGHSIELSGFLANIEQFDAEIPLLLSVGITLSIRCTENNCVCVRMNNTQERRLLRASVHKRATDSRTSVGH